MPISPFAVLATAAIASGAAIYAIASNRFRKGIACIIALAAGIAPWLFFAMWNEWLPGSTPLSVISIFGSGPLFLIAFFLYGIGEGTGKLSNAARACLVGMCAGFGYSLFLSGLLSKME